MIKFTKFLATLIVCVSIINCVSYATENQISVYINDEKIEFAQELYMKNDRVMVPMRKIFEKLDAVVVWDNDTKSITTTKGETSSILAIGIDIMYVNGVAVKLDVAPELVYSTTFVPLRAVSEMFGCEVGWDGILNRVDIYSGISQDSTVYYENFYGVPDFGAVMNIKPTIVIEDNNFNYNITNLENDAEERYRVIMQENGFIYVSGNAYSVYTKGGITVLAGYSNDVFRVIIYKN